MLAVNLPQAITRLILNSDGSTTLNLESLLQTSIHVNVIQQQLSSANDRCVHKQHYLTLLTCQAAPIIKRETHLISSQKQLLVKALVYLQTSTQQLLALDNSPQPLGKTLISHGRKQFRRIISTGNSEWDEGRGCAYKTYLLELESGHQLYINERFNPQFITPLSD